MKLIFALLINALANASIIIVLTIFTLSADAQICTDPVNVIYGMTNSGFIYPINVNTGNVGTGINPAYPGNAPSGANAIGYNSINGKFYYFKRNYPSSPQEFVSFDPVGNTYTVLATSPVTANVNSGCVNFNGTGYYCLDQNANLCYYNILVNTWTTITSAYVDASSVSLTSNLKTYSSGDIAIDGLGNLWITCSGSSKYGVYKLSAPLPTSAKPNVTLTQIVPISAMPSGGNFAGIAFSSTGQIYMSTSSGDNKLYRLESNSSLTYLTTFTLDGVGADLTSCNYPFSVLAVQWENFSATLENAKYVSLAWSVSQETNVKGYYIERSVDQINWNEIGFVESKGNDQFAEQYNFNDNNPSGGLNYYRIAETDADGSTKYSAIKTITLGNIVHAGVNVWPNPARNIVYIQNEGTDNNLEMQIFDPFGKIITMNVLHAGKNEVNVSGLPAGTYFVHTQCSNGESQNQKIVKL